jgi:glutathione S-transferase
MLELHQFRHSSFCEKVRLVLAAKRLPYTVVEVTPGLGQLELFRLSGQRQVPVLTDGTEVIADSSAIALYLEAKAPEPPLLPADPVERTALLPEATPAPMRSLLGAIPGELFSGLGEAMGRAERQQLQMSLEHLAVLVDAAPYLVGQRLSLADLAVAAQLSLLKFPASSGAPLAERGVPGVADHPLLEPLFRWRDRLYTEIGRVPPAPGSEPV